MGVWEGLLGGGGSGAHAPKDKLWSIRGSLCLPLPSI